MRDVSMWIRDGLLTVFAQDPVSDKVYIAKDNFLLIGIGFLALIVLFFVFAIRHRLKRKKKFKAFLDEQLEPYLQVGLYENKYAKAGRYDIDTYFYRQLMSYAESIAVSNIRKKDRYDKNGQYKPEVAAAISGVQMNVRGVFTADGRVLSNAYCSFITEYRPEYKVCDFPKSISEYIEFAANPNSFVKHPRPGDTEELPVGTTEKLDETDVKTDEPSKEEPKQTLLSAVVDDEILLEIDVYSTKLAEKKKAKQPSIDVDAEYKKNYGKLHRMFINGKSLNDDFAYWVMMNKPESSVQDFRKLIPEYIRYVKTK